MKKTNIFLSLAFTALCLTNVSCSEKDDNDLDTVLSEKEAAYKAAASDYVNHTVIPTYEAMSTAACDLYDDCVAIRDKHAAGTLATADVEKAANHWKTARKHWELSEAFLFGPAADHNIDPHIDSWPLDKDAMDRLLAQIRNGAELSIDNNFGYGLLGFHSIEYLLFQLNDDEMTSRYHDLDYTAEELEYLVIVAEDLRNQCVCLEACWRGTENLSAAKKAILEEADLDKGKNHGSMMNNAGEAGSIYKTYQAVAEEIIQGCIDIADEVGNTKIGRPCLGVSTDDRNYIESPYSLNSIEDFVDNIKSIENSYAGTLDGDKSISDRIRKVNPDLDKRVRQGIEDAKTAISAIPEPLTKNAKGEEARNAVKVVGEDLVSLLEEVYSNLNK